MNSRERFLTASRLGIPDCIPAAPYMGNYGAKLAGVPISEYNTNGAKMAEAQLKAWQILQQDVLVAQSDNYYIAEGFGTKIHQPYDSTPHLIKPALGGLAEVGSLKPLNPYADGRMPVYLDAVSRLKNTLKGEAAVRGPGTGPFSLAGHLLGVEDFLCALALAESEDDKDSQQRIFELLELTSDTLILFLKALVLAGTDVAMCGDSLASPDMISPYIYEKYVFPYEKKVFSAIGPVCAKAGIATLLHICGDTTGIMPLMCQTGANIIELDYKVSLKEMKRLYGDRICLMGNLNPSAVLMQGTPEAVSTAARKCIDDAAAGGGFVLGSGCEVSPNTPVENVKALINAARASNYPAV
jgi:uroporphyrinogen decarboxylase